ncbi:CDP-glycerol glycerophosphotransferase family protein [Selenomonadales bacterium OttesenSCG-928-I06]|nr:CDP-glycerol glycerophosphotransferase family protein [Selenomonadales bacterium OttesenSCG-928-I06]
MKKFFINLISIFIPHRSWRKKTRVWLKNNINIPPVFVIQSRYINKIKSLQKKPEKIIIVFLVWENSKWNGDILYKKFANSKNFKPIVLVVSEDPKDYEFYELHGYEVYCISNDNDLQKHNPDIIFYQQPWYSLADKFTPAKLSKYALLCYFPYAISTTIELPMIWNKCELFFKSLYCHFVFNQTLSEQFKSYGVFNTIVTGHPKLDVYNTPIKINLWKNKNKYKIIYAPHHSFEDTSLKWATFQWNGKEILKMAKNNPDTEWVFKPHPIFKKNLLNNKIMTAQEIDSYFDEWAKIGQVYESGNYFDIFRTSNLLITDCGSFLTEYLPTKNPVIHLVAQNKTTVYRSSIYEQSSRNYYKVKNSEELEQTFNMLVKENEDPLKTNRLKDASEITFSSAENIFYYIENLLKK